MVVFKMKLHLCVLIGLLALQAASAQPSNAVSASTNGSWLLQALNSVAGWLNAFFGMLTGRIFGGSTATTSQYKYIAFVAYHPIGAFRTKFKIALCSGAILTTKKILSAASCFSILDGDKSVYVGASATNNKFSKGTGTQYEIESKAYYEQGTTKYDFKENPFLHDLAIVTLKTEMAFSSTVGAAVLPTTTENPTAAATTYGGKTLTIVGYGLDQDITNIGNATSGGTDAKQALKSLKTQELRSASQTGLNDTECGKQLEVYLTSNSNFTEVKLPDGTTITKADFAAQAATRICPEMLVVKGTNAGPCLFGDNGGPMVFGDKVVGVLSILVACSNTTMASFGNELSGPHLVWVRANGS